MILAQTPCVAPIDQSLREGVISLREGCPRDLDGRACRPTAFYLFFGTTRLLLLAALSPAAATARRSLFSLVSWCHGRPRSCLLRDNEEHAGVRFCCLVAHLLDLLMKRMTLSRACLKTRRKNRIINNKRMWSDASSPFRHLHSLVYNSLKFTSELLLVEYVLLDRDSSFTFI